MAICEVSPVRQMVAICPKRNEPAAAKISRAARVGMATAPTTPENSAEDQQHPQTGEDRRPAGARPGGPVEGGLADRTADGLALEEPGAEVADALGDEVDVGVGAGAVVVGGGLGDADTLHEHDRRHRERAGEQRPRERRPLGPGRQRDPSGDVALVLDLGDVGAGQDHGDGRHRQREHGAEGGDAGAAEQDDDGERGDAGEDRGGIDAGSDG